MQLDAELPFDDRHQFARADATMLGSIVKCEAHDLGGDLVGSLRAARSWDESLQSAASKRLRHAKAGGPRDTEARRGFGQGLVFEQHQPHHFVTHLQSVLGIEELGVLREEWILYFVGRWIECSGVFQLLQLVFLMWFHGHQQGVICIHLIIRYIYISCQIRDWDYLHTKYYKTNCYYNSTLFYGPFIGIIP